MPRGGIHFFLSHKGLGQGGTHFDSLKSLGFLCLESHRFDPSSGWEDGMSKSQWAEARQCEGSYIREFRSRWKAYRFFPWVERRLDYFEGPLFECFGMWTERRWRASAPHPTRSIWPAQ